MSKAAPSKAFADGSFAESAQSLWPLVFGPAIWMLHFLLSYVTAAVWCAKSGGSLGAVRSAVAVYTLLALAAIGFAARSGWRRYRCGGAAPHDRDSAAGRHGFLGFTALLLCGLSFVATLYVALPILFIGSCR